MSVRDTAGNEYHVIDGDGHAWEMPLGLWDKYLPSNATWQSLSKRDRSEWPLANALRRPAHDGA